MTLTLFPVSVVGADAGVLLLTDAVLLVVKPLALVLHGLFFAALGGVGVSALAFAFLRAFTNSVSFSYKQSAGLAQSSPVSNLHLRLRRIRPRRYHRWGSLLWLCQCSRGMRCGFV